MSDTNTTPTAGTTGAATPCGACNGYGYLGHTNPSYGIRCEDCDGTGLRQHWDQAVEDAAWTARALESFDARPGDGTVAIGLLASLLADKTLTYDSGYLIGRSGQTTYLGDDTRALLQRVQAAVRAVQDDDLPGGAPDRPLATVEEVDELEAREALRAAVAGQHPRLARLLTEPGVFDASEGGPAGG